ncbi:hypothetical protein LNQ81_14660 [Myroides sp. M-43]|uniref:hypothetical protein n=1 Tax=Myroides oncorhynchi TaxID=2893756 RepID=UPI001E5F59F9|nr:hypothetical protein [Myroides oncorhynchi]MCC9043918.1 hypothetical protein [Myroides oncorhynchi]
MRVALLTNLLMLTSVTACTQVKSDNLSLEPLKVDVGSSVPFLTKQNDFIYVDKSNLKPINSQRYKSASLYTSTGFAVVINDQGEYGVIDSKGKTIVNFTDKIISLEVENGLTFYKKEREYEKKMPIWNWEWNILGGAIKKEQTYHQVEIGVLETKQVLLEKDFPYLYDTYYLNMTSVDEHHIFWNECIYQIKKGRLHRVERHITELLGNKRFIKASGTNFSIYELNQKNAVHKELKGSETLTIQFGSERIVLNEINKERYAPEVPKLLVDTKTNDVYVFPQYDKVFPKAIKEATPAQIDFIKRTSLVYSIANSPYFLLGVFNNDHDIWAYDWLYLDINGQVVEHLDLDSFKVADQIGRLVWPSKEMILPHQKVTSVKYYADSNELYLVNVKGKEGDSMYGVWDRKGQLWSIEPEYTSILALDTAKGIYALQKGKEGNYVLYNNDKKEDVGMRAYKYISYDGSVQVILEGRLVSYYIDIYTGKEYLE